jgi:hypothetical protein
MTKPLMNESNNSFHYRELKQKVRKQLSHSDLCWGGGVLYTCSYAKACGLSLPRQYMGRK